MYCLLLHFQCQPGNVTAGSKDLFEDLNDLLKSQVEGYKARGVFTELRKVVEDANSLAALVERVMEAAKRGFASPDLANFMPSSTRANWPAPLLCVSRAELVTFPDGYIAVVTV